MGNCLCKRKDTENPPKPAVEFTSLTPDAGDDVRASQSGVSSTYDYAYATPSSDDIQPPLSHSSRTTGSTSSSARSPYDNVNYGVRVPDNAAIHRLGARGSTSPSANSPYDNVNNGAKNLASPRSAASTSTSTNNVKSKSIIVAAIDFGTTFSGFAYCTKQGYKDPSGPKIQLHPWIAQNSLTAKAPTCVLLNLDQTFRSFGYEANTEFVENKSYADQFYFFKHFKMMLYKMKDEISRETILESENGESLPAIQVFAAIINFFKAKLLDDLNGKGTSFHNSDIHWVLTVPAIWNLKAKQFMKEASNLAGIEDYQLTLALEPEAASIYCRKLKMSDCGGRTFGGGPTIPSFKAGDKYLIMDLGGGTIDITAHEVLEDGHLKEIVEPTGGHWGGLRVNEAFTRLLQRLCGQDVLAELQQHHPTDWQELVDEFEKKKCAYKPGNNFSMITLRIPSTLNDECIKVSGCSLRERINQSFQNRLEFKGDKLKIDTSLFESFFTDSVTETVNQVRTLLRQTPQLHDVGTILVVGGYAESPLMRRAIIDAFEDRCKIIIPDNPSLGILQGAVMYGFELDAISSRVCKYTYGIGHQRRFREGRDDPRLRREHGGRSYVDDAFDKYVSKGDVVKYGQFQNGKDYYPVEDQQTQAWIDLYASEERDPQYVHEKSCVCLGFVGFELSPRKPGLDATVILELSFGGTDIEVRATEKRTGKVTKATCNFLG